MHCKVKTDILTVMYRSVFIYLHMIIYARSQVFNINKGYCITTHFPTCRYRITIFISLYK